MADKYPVVLYHEDGRHQTVYSDTDAKNLGGGWSDKINDRSLQAMRAASGAIGETIIPVQRTSRESV